MERATGTEVYGCGSPQSTDITLNIQTTTGGNFSISLNGKNTVEHLKKLVSKKLKVAKDRICLLHRERQLREGTLEENGLLDGSRVILLPSVETGLLSQRPENSVMQALESLNETQVNDFLSGKSPLNLTMRLGDHMMLIQLQLSTLNSSGSRSLRTAAPAKSSTASPSNTPKCDPEPSTSSQTSQDDAMNNETPTTSETGDKNKPRKKVLLKHDLEMLKNAFDLYSNMTVPDTGLTTDDMPTIAADVQNFKGSQKMDTGTNTTPESNPSVGPESEQSPIKSLSNLVSSPLASTSECTESIANSVRTSLLDLLKKNKTLNEATTPPKMSPNPASQKSPQSSHSPDSAMSDDSDNFTDQSSFLAESTIDEYPMENLFNSAVDKGLFEDQDESMMDREISNLATMSHGTQESTSSATLPSFQSINEPLKTKRFQYLLHKTSKFKHPIGQNKQKAFMQSVVNKHIKKRMQRQDAHVAQPSTSRTEPYISNSRKLILQPSDNMEPEDLSIKSTASTSRQIFRAPEVTKKSQATSPVPPVQADPKDLIEASKNLTQKLKKLSKEVLTNKIDLRTHEAEPLRPKIGPGAVIESMKHHGKGIYSGTFSGTLNPALQDRFGRPKRDISTIIHILNDLLCATPPIALANKDTTFSCSTGDEAAKCPNCSQSTCSYGACEGHSPAACACLEPCPHCAGNSDSCEKCDNAKSLALDNNKTKCKLERLRLIMQQKKQRREARKLKTLPYTSSPNKALATPESPPGIQDEIESLA